MSIHRARGFTLIELMIVVAIIGSLLAIALPAYSRYMIKARRGNAESTLVAAAQVCESSFSVLRVYTGCIANTDAMFDEIEGYYTVTIDATGINAVPITNGKQKNDGKLRVEFTGLRQWDKNNNGTFDTGDVF